MDPLKYCAPAKAGEEVTCFSIEALRKIAEAWNRADRGNHITLTPTPTKASLIQEIKSRIRDETPCEEDFCLLEHPLVKSASDRDMRINTFRQPIPEEWVSHPRAWLSTTDIRDVLMQYVRINPEFRFIGPVPIDFDTPISQGIFSNSTQCIVTDLCQLDLETEYQKGKRCIGVVFNLDPHDRPGSHWVSLFVNMRNGGIYFFDSVGKFPVKEITEFMARLRKQGNRMIRKGIIPFAEVSDEHLLEYPLEDYTEETVILQEEPPAFVKGMPLQILSREVRGGQTGSRNIYSIQGKANKTLQIRREGSEVRGGKQEGDGGKRARIKGFRLFYNDIQHQRLNTECGVYSIFFIDSMLGGKTFRDFTNELVRDKAMNHKRKDYYRPHIKQLKPTGGSKA